MTDTKPSAEVKLPTVSLVMIVKNEEAWLGPCLDSVKDVVDEIVIVDTGSTDKTKEIAESYGAKVHDFKWIDDFSAARNFAFTKATKDFILWLDADDRLDGAEKLKPMLSKLEPQFGCVLMQYFYGFDEFGNCTALHLKNRVVRNDGNFTWKGRIHEDLIPIMTTSVFSTTDVAVYHRADGPRVRSSSDRNLKVALSEYKERAVDPRVVFNVANAYLALGRHEESIKYFLEYLTKSGWDEEKYIAHCRIAMSLSELGQFDEAMNMYFRAVKLRPKYADAFRGLAVCAMKKGDLPSAEEYLLSMLSKDKPDSMLVWNPFEYEIVPYFDLAQVYMHLHKIDKAIEACGIFVEKSGGHEKGEKLLEDLKALKKDLDFVDSMVAAGNRLAKDGLKDNLWNLIIAIPKEFRSEPRVVQLKHDNFARTTSSGRDVAIWCGRSWEDWDASSLEKGIGGSEEAVIRLARLWQKSGWNVTVYNNCGLEEKVMDGVRYTPFWEFNPKDKFDVFISWRDPLVFDYDINAKVKLLDLHDVPNLLDYTSKRIKNITKIMVKTMFHRNLLPTIPNHKIAVVGHGVDEEEFEGLVPRALRQVVYTSSYDRGLENLLDIWPEVVAEVPDAKLLIAYGWDLFDRIRAGDKDKMAWKEKMVAKMTHPSIKELGRLSHKDVAKLMKASDVFAYPCHFEEIFCIAAAKAQMAGAVPVVAVSDSCLRETVGIGVQVTGSMKREAIRPEGSPSFDDVLGKYKDELIKFLKDDKLRDNVRQQAMDYARKTFSWPKVAEAWEEEFLKA
jgi:glycosyltransferase involved in cell wall biosynthesis